MIMNEPGRTTATLCSLFSPLFQLLTFRILSIPPGRLSRGFIETSPIQFVLAFCLVLRVLEWTKAAGSLLKITPAIVSLPFSSQSLSFEQGDRSRVHCESVYPLARGKLDPANHLRA